jgi:hypothetical protein
MSDIFEIPENFHTTILDFTKDLSTTFPEYAHLWNQWTDPNIDPYEIRSLFKHCLMMLPERFFDIIYENKEIFLPESTTNVCFLPGVDFRVLYNCEGVTETTQKSIWKYLQLLMFTLVGSVKNKSGFGETADMFDGINEDDLQDKMKETFENMSSFFKNMEENMSNTQTETATGEEDAEKPSFNFDKTTGMPNLDEIHEHLKGLFDGKIGSMAKNIAEEISGDFESILGEDFKDVQSTKDIFQKMMKNPAKMMTLIKKVGDKIKNKMDSGEISKDEIMREAGDILKKMKEMGGGDDKFQEMFKNMAKTMGGKGAKIDMNALERMTKHHEMKERMRNKLNKKKDANFVLEQTNRPNNYVFKLPEEGEQPRSAVPPPRMTDEELIAEFEKDPTSIGGNPAGEPTKKKSAKKKKGGKK